MRPLLLFLLISFTASVSLPQFPGGDVALARFIQNNTRYPDSAKVNDVEGRVLVKFIINGDGSVADAQVVRHINKYLEDEALRVIRMLPAFKPSLQDGKPVAYTMVLPIEFKLGNK